MFAWQATVQDEAGNAVPLPVATVYLEDGVTLASIFNEDGVALPNPLTGTLEGFVQFWADVGVYKVVGADGGDETEVWPVVISAPIDVLSQDITVRVPEDYATLTDAFNDLRSASVKGNAVEIIISSGHRLTRGLRLNNGDWSSFTISSVDPQVFLSPEFVPVSATDVLIDLSQCSFVFVNCHAPRFNILVNLEGRALAAYVGGNGMVGRVAMGKGAINARFGAHIRTGRFYADGTVWTGHTETGVQITRSSVADISSSTLTGNCTNGAVTGGAALDISRGSIAYANACDCSNSGNDGIAVRRARVSAEDVIVDGAVNYGFTASHGSWVWAANGSALSVGSTRLRCTDGSTLIVNGVKTDLGVAAGMNGPTRQDTNVIRFNFTTFDGVVYNNEAPSSVTVNLATNANWAEVAPGFCTLTKRITVDMSVTGAKEIAFQTPLSQVWSVSCGAADGALEGSGVQTRLSYLAALSVGYSISKQCWIVRAPDGAAIAGTVDIVVTAIGRK